MKIGYNFNYRFAKISKDGRACVVVDEELWLKSRTRGSERIISPYPYGEGRCEDAIVDAVREAFAELAQDASETGVVVRETFGPWQQARWIINDCTLDSGIVKTLMTSLSALNRVTVAVPKETAKKNK